MATVILNNWKDSLPLGVATYAKLIDEDWDKFTITVKPPYNDMGYITISSILRSTSLIKHFFGVILRYSDF